MGVPRAERLAKCWRVASGRSAGSGDVGYTARFTGTGEPAGRVAVRLAHSPPAAVLAVTVAERLLTSRAVTAPAIRTSSPSWIGFANRTFAVPRSSQAAPNASTSGWVR